MAAGAESEIERYQEYARATFKKDMRVNIRLSKKDLQAILKRALEEGIPYQTPMGSILHKYADGRLLEKGRRYFPTALDRPFRQHRLKDYPGELCGQVMRYL